MSQELCTHWSEAQSAVRALASSKILRESIMIAFLARSQGSVLVLTQPSLSTQGLWRQQYKNPWIQHPRKSCWTSTVCSKMKAIWPMKQKRLTLRCTSTTSCILTVYQDVYLKLTQVQELIQKFRGEPEETNKPDAQASLVTPDAG